MKCTKTESDVTAAVVSLTGKVSTEPLPVPILSLAVPANMLQFAILHLT